MKKNCIVNGIERLFFGSKRKDKELLKKFLISCVLDPSHEIKEEDITIGGAIIERMGKRFASNITYIIKKDRSEYKNIHFVTEALFTYKDKQFSYYLKNTQAFETPMPKL